MNDRHGLIFKEQIKLYTAKKMIMGLITDEERMVKRVIFFEHNKLGEMKEKYGDRLEVFV